MELEATRRGVSIWMRLTLVWGFLYQTLGGAVISSLYFAFMLNMYPAPGSRESAISPAGAHSVFFSMLFGYLPCVLGMFVIGGWTEVATFQFFPIFVWALRAGYQFVFEESDQAAKSKSAEVDDNEGYLHTQLVYFILSAASAGVHVYYVVRPAVASNEPLEYFRQFFVPWLATPGPEHADIQNAVFHLFQWDLIVIMGSAFLAGVWDLSWSDIEVAAFWFVQGTVMLGPGTALAGVWAYRELLMKNSRVKATRRAEATKIKKDDN